MDSKVSHTLDIHKTGLTLTTIEKGGRFNTHSGKFFPYSKELLEKVKKVGIKLPFNTWLNFLKHVNK